MKKYQDKYRIPSARAQWKDYGEAGAYFITICTHDRACYFGKIVNAKMELSAVGIVADVFWHEIKNHAQQVSLEAFVVMPNHIHGILVLNEDEPNRENMGLVDDVVETTHALSLQNDQSFIEKTPGQKRFQHQGENTVSSIIGSYKSAVTKHAHRLGFEFEWQTRFYDIIIRDEKAYLTICDYIVNNPVRWDADKFNPIKNQHLE